MNVHCFRAARVALVLCLFVLAVQSNPVHAQGVDMSDKDRAAVAKETVKQKRDTSSSRNKNNGDCGSIDIGNDDDKRGSSRIAQRDKTVIITGNIYNTADCKRN